MTDLAIYDMDRTITRRATYTPFLIHCARQAAPWRLALAPAVAGSMAGYAAGLIDRARLKEINHRLLLGYARSDAEMKPLVDSFAEATMAKNIQPGAIRAIARDRAEGRRLVMATASYALYVDAIAERLGFDDVIATRSVRGSDGRLLARIDGNNCYGPAKLAMIKEWFATAQIERGHVRFYSDHASDAPVLDWADEAVAVNPSRALRLLAQKRGWEIVDWRS
ncbi:HAD family hydrolase [Sphingomonas sp. RB1R13]|uniref:HAD family hydrolase n=1 Tax=Sphingomonas sp. RB1R13 TaxID=3096159 RepID=UPI002FCA0E8A